LFVISSLVGFVFNWRYLPIGGGGGGAAAAVRVCAAGSTGRRQLGPAGWLPSS